jgi:hypothetical protein
VFFAAARQCRRYPVGFMRPFASAGANFNGAHFLTSAAYEELATIISLSGYFLNNFTAMN